MTITDRCQDVVGAWSPIVNGLRARLTTSGSKPDGSALDITLEVENVGSEAVEISWTGVLPLGFASFRLDDARGTDIEPEWRFGGNAPSGEARALFRARSTQRYEVHRGAFVTMTGKRALRIGAFWGRELPTDGQKRFLRATLAAGPPHVNAPDHAYEGTAVVLKPPPARAFVGPLEVPAVCIE